MKGYREKDVVSNAWNAGAIIDLKFIENGKSECIFFHVVTGVAVNLDIENNQLIGIILMQQ